MRLTWSFALFSSAVVFSGCSTASFVAPTSTSTNSVPGVALHGIVHGGQSPIQGAHVYLYQVNQTGYGNAATSLLTTGAGTDSYGTYVTTDMNGAWSLTGNYGCSSMSPYVYVLSIGGGPAGTGTNNPNIGLAAPLGPCIYATLISYSDVVVNEVSTVAAAYAFAAYASDATHVSTGTSSLAATGLQNAFQNFLNLETFLGGTAHTTTTGGYGTVPAAEINTLANILAACVNSVSPFTYCSTLFSNAMNGSVAPTETVTAAINIAHNPGANIANLFALQADAGAPFVPNLSSAPNDFTVAITYTKGGLSSPQSVAIDASGNVWVANGANGTVSEFGPTSPGGVPAGYAAISSNGDTGAAEPWGIAIDTSSPAHVWVSNASGGTGGETLGEFSSSGALINTFPDMTTTGTSNLDFPRGVAIDNSGNIWVADSENATLTEYDPGTNAFSSYSSVGGLDFPSGVAVDIAGNIWVSNGSGSGATSNGSISVFGSSGAVNSNDPITAGGINGPFGIAIDGSGNAWVSNSSGSITKLSPQVGGSITGTNFAPAIGLSGPKGLAIDGAGNIWVADSISGAISEMSSSGGAISPATGYGYCTTCISSMGLPFGVAIDGSGDVWMTGYSYGTLTEFVGAATPVVTPLAANLATSSAINKP